MDELIEEQERERPIRALRRKRLKALMTEYGGPKGLAAVAKTVDTHLITIEKGRRSLGDELATKLEAATGKPFGWMDGAVSDEALRLAQLFDRVVTEERREIVLARVLQSLAEFPETAEGAEAPRSPTGKRHQVN